MTVVPAAPDGAAADLLLHRWRRLDWRFLVPLETPARVACAGEVDDDLRVALPLLAPAVHRARSAADWEALSGRCDVVVLTRPDAAQLVPAVRALRPGGWLYVEVSRDRVRPRPRSVAGWRRALETQGLEDVTAYWHTPGLGDTRRIVPLDAAPAVRHALAEHRDSPADALRGAVLRCLHTVGALPLVVPAGSVTGRRPVVAP